MTQSSSKTQQPLMESSAKRPDSSIIDLTLRDVIELYPEQLRSSQIADFMRIRTHIDLVVSHAGFTASVCDLGGGIGLFTPGCAALGMKATLVDDFSDEVNYKFHIDTLGIHEKLGVNVVSADLLDDSLEFPPKSFDTVTTFDSMEHWHDSPKRLFSKVSRWLKPGGQFIIGVPNCVNLRKRLSVPLGYGKWSSMQEWYETPKFRGHVREPDVGDLKYIAHDMGLTGVRIIGRNWLGYRSSHRLIRNVTAVVDRLLQVWPQLCSDIYLIGRRAN